MIYVANQTLILKKKLLGTEKALKFSESTFANDLSSYFFVLFFLFVFCENKLSRMAHFKKAKCDET